MTKHAVRRVLIAVGLALGLGLGPAPVLGQSLPPDVDAALSQGAVMESPARLRAAVVESIARYPALAEAIVRAALAARPDDGAAIVSTAQTAFPAFAERFAQAPPLGPLPPAGAPQPATDPDVLLSPWSGEIDIGGSRITGNTESAEVSVDAKLIHERTLWRNEARVQFDFGDDDNVTDERRYFTSFETDYKLFARFYLLGFVSFEDDAFSGFAHRITETLGAGYGLIRLPGFILDVEAGLGARQTKSETTNDTETEIVGRLDGEFDWTISDHATLGGETTVILGADRTTIESTLALTANVLDRLAARLSFDIEHETNVEPGTEKTDTTTKASLVYSF